MTELWYPVMGVPSDLWPDFLGGKFDKPDGWLSVLELTDEEHGNLKNYIEKKEASYKNTRANGYKIVFIHPEEWGRSSLRRK